MTEVVAIDIKARKALLDNNTVIDIEGFYDDDGDQLEGDTGATQFLVEIPGTGWVHDRIEHFADVTVH